MRLMYLTAEAWPTHRPDVLALFGRYLPRHGIHADLVTERAAGPDLPWPGGRSLLCRLPGGRAAQHLLKLGHNLRTLAGIDAGQYDAIQVRDMSLTALAGLLVARLKGLRFYYWLSYPQSEGQIDRAKKRGPRAGLRFWFPLLQGVVGKWLLYRVVLPRADHVFVQSRQMQLDVARQGVPMEKMTPVPMGVDTEVANPERIAASVDERLRGKRVVVYLGVTDPLRRIDVLFEMLAAARDSVPDILLVLAGDTEDAGHRAWLREQAERLGVADQVLWLGWREPDEAWAYVRAAEVGLSPVPRGFLLDCGSPTKAVEYMGLGLPVLVSDNPDQQQVIEESGAGICVPLCGDRFAAALVGLLAAPPTMRAMGERGRAYVAGVRSYEHIARSVAGVYHGLAPAPGAAGG
ncbi:glycosyltransferase [Rugamonas sp. DEMB1]|uniref:glycosyltransferase n=1 Tax=Rugamonas sp. DEMB1 TaxID=3039386 RepID=UPI00244BB433|nr:glycosyltransferase [Rugamonas sp. DEMB1]WGG49141.1 glycosyltransferase [Rugamonas sp. DEMB1]